MIGARIGSYILVRSIGRGAMGAVFEAHHERLGIRVAIKLLHERFANDRSMLARLLSEARAAARIDHPGIVRLIDFGETPQGAYLVMEHLPGETLRARTIRRRAPLQEALGLVQQLAEALSCAHAQGVVHRDVKPDNIMLIPDSTVPGGERVKLIDFGIARRPLLPDETALTRVGAILGTPPYMSPEQCRGQVVDGKTDVYALGVVLFELLTGSLPYHGEVPALLDQQVHAPVPVLPGRRAEERRLAALVAGMMAKSPAERPSMGAVLHWLAEVAPGGAKTVTSVNPRCGGAGPRAPVARSAGPPAASPAPRLVGWARGSCWGGATMGLILLVGLCGTQPGAPAQPEIADAAHATASAPTPIDGSVSADASASAPPRGAPHPAAEDRGAAASPPPLHGPSHRGAPPARDERPRAAPPDPDAPIPTGEEEEAHGTPPAPEPPQDLAPLRLPIAPDWRPPPRAGVDLHPERRGAGGDERR